MSLATFTRKSRSPQIESGEYKVETRDGQSVSILAFDIHFRGMSHMILAEYNECYDYWPFNGRYNKTSPDCNLDLFIITPEPEVELSEFEKCVKECLEYDPEVVSDGDLLEATKEYAKELLSLARKELQPEKDLPRWKKCAPCDEDMATLPAWIVRFDAELAGESAVVHNDHYILFGDLEKLPKEE